MRKIALILTLVMLMSMCMLPIGSLAASTLNPYEGFATTSFDETTGSSSSYTANNGKLAVKVKHTFTYKDIDFGVSSPETVILEIANDPGYTDQVTELYADSVSGKPIATFTISKGTGWSNITEFKSEIKGDLSGVHTLYLVTTAKAVDYYNMAFRMALTGDAIYKEYSSDNNVYEDIADSPYRREINMMHDLGLMLKKEGEKFYPEHPVKRGDFVKIIYNMMHSISLSAEKGQTFSDVPQRSEYYDSVSFASGMGYISGYSDGTFKPEKFIKVSEAAKILGNILGYKHLAEDKGGYEAGYMTIAHKYDLFDGIDASRVLTNESLARIIYNAVCADFFEADEYGENDTSYSNNEDGVLSVTMNVYRGEGVVTSNNITSLAVPKTKFDKNHVSINGEDYVVGDSAARVLLGYECEFFYKKDGNTKTIVAIAPLETVKVTELNTRDDGITYIGTDRITYFDESDRKKEIKMERPYILYNGISISKKLSDLISKKGFRGKIRYIENDNGTEVLFIEEYINIEVGGINIGDNSVYDTISKKTFKYSGDNDYAYFEKDGQPIPISDVEVGNIAMLYEATGSDGRKFARFVLSDNIVSGDVSSISDGKAVIDGTEYEVARECKEEVTLGKYANFKINAYGEIVTLNYDNISKGKVAWLTRYGTRNNDAFSGEVLIEVLDEDSTIKEYALASKGYLDGERYEDSSAIITDDMCNQPICYVLNSEGKIRQLDTVVSKTGGDKDCLEYIDGYEVPGDETSTIKYWDWDPTGRILISTASGSPVADYILPQDARLLHQPKGTTEAEDYNWADGSNVSKVERALIYTFDKDSGYADVVVMKNTAGAVTTSFAVNKIVSKVDSEGETRTAISVSTPDGEKTYCVSEKTPADMEIVKKLTCGDYIRGSIFGEDIRNIEIVRLLSGESELSYGDGSKLTTLINKNVDNQGKIATGSTTERYIHAKVIDRNGKYLRIKRMNSGTEEFVYVGSMPGIEYLKNSGRGANVESGISNNDIEIGDEVLFVYVNMTAKSFYILGKAAN